MNMNKQKNKFHKNIRDINELDDVLFDTLSPPRQVLLLVATVLLVPLWFPLWIIFEIKKGKK